MERWFGLSDAFRWAGSLPSPDGLDEAIVTRRPDVVLLDWDMPGTDTSVLLARLAEAYPKVSFAVLSSHLDPKIIRTALMAGACGYLSKNRSPAALAMEVTLLAQGRDMLSDDVRAALARDTDSGEWC